MNGGRIDAVSPPGGTQASTATSLAPLLLACVAAACITVMLSALPLAPTITR